MYWGEKIDMTIVGIHLYEILPKCLCRPTRAHAPDSELTRLFNAACLAENQQIPIL
jgi:hypothetical protein